MTLINRLFLHPSRRLLQGYSLANLIAQILIVLTGGVVRLTGSGLGCPTWPKCTDDSLVTVPEQGIHGVIEFANRTLTGALIIVAGLAFLAALGQAKDQRRGLIGPAIAVIAGIFVQAVVGGVSVWVKLNPWIVATHFILSAILIAVASLLYWRALNIETDAVPQRAYLFSPLLTVIGSVTVVIGVLVTGAGPHAGDPGTPRNGFDLEVIEHWHAYPAYLTLALASLIWFWLYQVRSEGLLAARRIQLALVCILLLQAGVGILQARTGVPASLVAIHMLLASILVSLLTLQQLAIRSR